MTTAAGLAADTIGAGTDVAVEAGHRPSEATEKRPRASST